MTFTEKVVNLKDVDGLSWMEIARKLNCKRDKARSAYRNYYKRLDRTSDRNETIEFDDSGNVACATAKSPRIKTLEQLIEACKIDLTVWKVDRYVANKWEVGAKDRNKQIGIHPLFQIKAWLVRRNPEPIFPIVNPVSVSATYRNPPKPTRSVKSALVITDPHFGYSRDIQNASLTPFHDRRVLDMALQIAEHVQPNRIDMLGDWLDMADWSDKFLRSPEFYWTTQPALIEANWWNEQIRSVAPNAHISMHPGNHDERMNTAITTHLLAGYSLKSVDSEFPAMGLPNLLSLESLGIEWTGNYPDDGDWLSDTLFLKHGDVARSGSGATGKAILSKAVTSTVYGHIHRRELISKSIYERNSTRVITAFCPGCACHVDGRVPGHKTAQEWQQGIALIEYTDTMHTITPIAIEEGRAIYNGELFEARDRLGDLKKDVPDWNWT
ncbi:MAG: hypothetical protein DRP01_09020 [Archaeoglobales archaeon]|nr:MAG: hypothetical protein DRP01_09020 [Archaeoglobales archaeon]